MAIGIVETCYTEVAAIDWKKILRNGGKKQTH